ncbi:uncharacterized protein At1g28695-like [Corylus avellana]|uniref:uncharacterized protein At1g28695-like n=1 Tax=Corylus avellana TaxID=13451 RepID=UPI00286C8FEB|nr:uncharacterized protein At1g28695-like [Corylus avellana]
MNKHKDRVGLIALISLFLFVGLLYVFVAFPTSFKPLLSVQYNQCQPSKTGDDALEVALSEASMEDRTVIITIVNKAYVEGDKPMLDMFLDSFWVGEDTRELVDHLLLVAMDPTSFEHCKFLRLHCYMLEMEDDMDSKAEKLYMSDNFIKMMWRRTLFLGDVLKRGYSFIFTDTDVMWLRNPFPRLSQNGTIDLEISTDVFNGDEGSEANPMNTGFYMIRSNNKTISLFDAWYARKDNSTGLNDQLILGNMMRGGVLRDIGLTVRFLDTKYFTGFCQDTKDFKALTTVHANCCRTIRAKLADLSALIHDWKMFKRTSTNDSLTSGLSTLMHVACTDSWIGHKW